MTALGNFSAGDILTAADLNGLNNVTSLYRSGAVGYTSGTDHPSYYSLGSDVIVDVSNWHSTTSNSDRVTPDIAGYYLITAGCQLNGAGGSDFSVSTVIWKTGSPIVAGIVKGNFYDAPSCQAILYANGTSDYFHTTVFQNSGVGQSIMRRTFTVTLLRAG